MPESEIASLIQAISQVGSSALFALLAWYLITKHIPAMDDKQTKTLDRLADRFHETSRLQREHFAQNLDRMASEQRAACEREITGLSKIYENQIERIFHLRGGPD